MRSWHCAVLAIALGVGPLDVAAAPSEDPSAIEGLYYEGRALYDTADYDGAIAKWTEAYSRVGESPEELEIRSSLLYNLASAHEAAFEIDGDATHLTKARVLLERFEARIDVIYDGDAAATERARVHARIERIDEKLAAARGEPETEPEPAAETPAEPEPSPVLDPTDDGEPTDRADGPTRPLVISGAVLLGLGVGGLALGIGASALARSANTFDDDALEITDDALARRHDQIDRGERMNTLTYVGFIAGGVLTVTGAALVGLAFRKRRSGATAALLPSLGATRAGVALTGRF